MRQRPVADIIRDFADMLDSEECRDALTAVDPARLKLARMLDALGKYATQAGVDLRQLRPGDVAALGFAPRRLTDELRRFADALQRRHDAVLRIDPGYRRLTNALKAMNVYATWLGKDLGLGGRGLVTGNRLKMIGGV
jgi:hypothetical protein